MRDGARPASRCPVSTAVLLWVLVSPIGRALCRAGIPCALSDQEEEEDEEGEAGGDVDVSAGRFVRYQFTPAFLRLRTVGAT